MEEVVKYQVLGGEINEHFVYLKNRHCILTAIHPHFTRAKTNFTSLVPGIGGYNEEMERAETIYKTIRADPKNNDEIKEFIIGSRKLMNLKIEKYPNHSPELSNLKDFVSNYELSKELIKKFF